MKKMIKSVAKVFLKVFYLFKIKKNKVFLMCFDGSVFGFDQKAIVDYINDNSLDNKYEMYWGVKNKNCLKKFSYKNVNFVVIKSLLGLYHMMTSEIIIYNINPPSYVPFRKKQYLVNTWHGISYKKVGKYAPAYNKKQFNLTNIFLSHSEQFSNDVIRDSFEYSGKILNIGVPRNDILFSDKREDTRLSVLKKYNIDGKKVVLYAPTFRNNFELGPFNIEFEKLCSVLEKKFEGNWVVLLRLHPMIAEKFKLDSDNFINVSLYPDIQDLLCTADILISDYSSAMWDFALTKKPVFIYATDIDTYDRGMYIPCENLPFPLAKNNKELLKNILDFNLKLYNDDLNKYFNDMICFENGKSCQELFKYFDEKRRNEK